MRTTVWKHQFVRVLDSPFEVEMPAGARIVACQVQDFYPTIWFECDPDAPKLTRTFELIGTGQDVPGDAHHVGTVQHPDSPLVLHLYETTVGT